MADFLQRLSRFRDGNWLKHTHWKENRQPRKSNIPIDWPAKWNCPPIKLQSFDLERNTRYWNAKSARITFLHRITILRNDTMRNIILHIRNEGLRKSSIWKHSTCNESGLNIGLRERQSDREGRGVQRGGESTIKYSTDAELQSGRNSSWWRIPSGCRQGEARIGAALLSPSPQALGSSNKKSLPRFTLYALIPLFSLLSPLCFQLSGWNIKTIRES